MLWQITQAIQRDLQKIKVLFDDSNGKSKIQILKEKYIIEFEKFEYYEMLSHFFYLDPQGIKEMDDILNLYFPDKIGPLRLKSQITTYDSILKTLKKSIDMSNFYLENVPGVNIKEYGKKRDELVEQFESYSNVFSIFKQNLAKEFQKKKKKTFSD